MTNAGAPAGGSPARVGIDPGVSRRVRSFGRLPRPRGDRPDDGTGTESVYMAPPPARG